jgi:hypothetical protein
MAKYVEDGVSRGFTRRTNSVDSYDKIPHKYEILASFWEDEDVKSGFNILEKVNDGQPLSLKRSTVPEGFTHWTENISFHKATTIWFCLS